MDITSLNDQSWIFQQLAKDDGKHYIWRGWEGAIEEPSKNGDE